MTVTKTSVGLFCDCIVLNKFDSLLTTSSIRPRVINCFL